MDHLDRSRPPAIHPPPLLDGAATRLLAEALAHVLRRDDAPPARWRTPAFAAAVEAARVRLDTVGAIPDLSRSRSGPSWPLTFKDAMDRIARDPDDVAVAIRRLELGVRHRLPNWPDLLQRGLPQEPSDLDTALWFG